MRAQVHSGRSARVAATFDLTDTTEAVIGYEHRDEKFVGNNRTAGTFCNFGQIISCSTKNIFSPFYDLRTINNSIFSEITHLVDPATTLKFGARRDYFHTRAGELRDFLGSTTFPTSNGERDDIANSAFVRLEKEVFPAGVAFIAFANGERSASNIERELCAAST